MAPSEACTCESADGQGRLLLSEGVMSLPAYPNPNCRDCDPKLQNLPPLYRCQGRGVPLRHLTLPKTLKWIGSWALANSFRCEGWGPHCVPRIEFAEGLEVIGCRPRFKPAPASAALCS